MVGKVHNGFHPLGYDPDTCEACKPSDICDVIRPGDRVTIRNRFGQDHVGRAVMRGPAGWVLNMGGRHGTPAIANDENVVKVVKARKHRGD